MQVAQRVNELTRRSSIVLVVCTRQEALAARLQAVQHHIVPRHERDHALVDEVHAIADVGSQAEDVPAGPVLA